ncbi:hypothetical protein BLNAU_4206 [Blattamonas nauphoetae]|uniref:Uncharacterized protein n=1 Tax=Blattamonas nauphoetae TaxID=2049346 RepID=A0ABQ9YAS9_9EUKA|nr:hypothetical protein BLNAU_4206 [Blattamonas nauphoetae]
MPPKKRAAPKSIKKHPHGAAQADKLPTTDDIDTKTESPSQSSLLPDQSAPVDVHDPVSESADDSEMFPPSEEILDNLHLSSDDQDFLQSDDDDVGFPVKILTPIQPIRRAPMNPVFTDSSPDKKEPPPPTKPKKGIKGKAKSSAIKNVKSAAVEAPDKEISQKLKDEEISLPPTTKESNDGDISDLDLKKVKREEDGGKVEKEAQKTAVDKERAEKQGKSVDSLNLPPKDDDASLFGSENEKEIRDDVSSIFGSESEKEPIDEDSESDIFAGESSLTDNSESDEEDADNTHKTKEEHEQNRTRRMSAQKVSQLLLRGRQGVAALGRRRSSKQQAASMAIKPEQKNKKEEKGVGSTDATTDVSRGAEGREGLRVLSRERKQVDMSDFSVTMPLLVRVVHRRKKGKKRKGVEKEPIVVKKVGRKRGIVERPPRTVMTRQAKENQERAEEGEKKTEGEESDGSEMDTQRREKRQTRMAEILEVEREGGPAPTEREGKKKKKGRKVGGGVGVGGNVGSALSSSGMAFPSYSSFILSPAKTTHGGLGQSGAQIGNVGSGLGNSGSMGQAPLLPSTTNLTSHHSLPLHSPDPHLASVKGMMRTHPSLQGAQMLL